MRELPIVGKIVIQDSTFDKLQLYLKYSLKIFEKNYES